MAGDTGEYPGWEEDGFGGLTLNTVIHSTQIRLATVVKVEAEGGVMPSPPQRPLSPPVSFESAPL